MKQTTKKQDPRKPRRVADPELANVTGGVLAATKQMQETQMPFYG